MKKIKSKTHRFLFIFQIPLLILFLKKMIHGSNYERNVKIFCFMDSYRSGEGVTSVMQCETTQREMQRE